MPKKKSWKNGQVLDQNHGLTHLKKWQFFDCLNFFYTLESSFFVLEYQKRHFPGLYSIKRKIGKMAILGPKPSVHPFEK